MHSIHGLFSGNSTESIAIAPSIENITYCNGCYCVPAATRVNHGGNILNGLENVDIQERSNNIVQCKEQNPTDSLYTISVSKECSTKIHTDSNEPKHPNTQVDVSRSSSSESAANELIESSKPDATDYAKSYTAGRPPRLLQKLLAIDPVQHIRNKSDIMSDIDLMLEKLASEFERQEKLSSITL
ncbi:hypothetical protein KP509_39G016500 [Ceratopteris richardii]|nr:hypothetical protein KP509_39G016500 [Ceratopteris richardii]